MTLHSSKTVSLIGAVALALLLASCGGTATNEEGHGDESEADHAGEAEGAHAEAEEAKKGEHGGRLLEQGGYAVEPPRTARHRSTKPGCTRATSRWRQPPAVSKSVSIGSRTSPRTTPSSRRPTAV